MSLEATFFFLFPDREAEYSTAPRVRVGVRILVFLNEG